MAEKEAKSQPWFLRGNGAPRQQERTETKLSVRGNIPSSLNGVYLRTGPTIGQAPANIGFSAMACCTVYGSVMERPSGTRIDFCKHLTLLSLLEIRVSGLEICVAARAIPMLLRTTKKFFV